MPHDSSNNLQRVAFVAMPFGTKPTDLRERSAPQQVDFDALWSQAFAPALAELGYLPLRADNQVGSVIVKDMLEQLVHADLVLADMSIANGNVYYELGVRHAARPQGCVLLRAKWSRPLFDIAQITQVLYPFPNGEPTEDDYVAVRRALVSSIPALTDSTGPVWELTQIATPGARHSSHVLKEVDRGLFEFTHRLLTATTKASRQNKAPLRELLTSTGVPDLPDHALRDLIQAASDHLTGHEVLALLRPLETRLKNDPFTLEHKAHALGRVGETEEAIALLETVNQRRGATAARLVSLGELCAQLAEQSRQAHRRRWRRRALQAFRDSRSLDLNDYRASTKLLAELMRSSDRPSAAERAEADAGAAVLSAAVARATDSGDDLDLHAARLILAVHARDQVAVRNHVDAVLDVEGPSWRLAWLVRTIDTALGWIPEDERSPFDMERARLAEHLPIPQQTLVSTLMPKMRADGRCYRKTLGVDARPADPGEVVVSVTSDGEETTNRAEEGDMLVRARTEAREEYLVSGEKFAQLYDDESPAAADGFAGYRPRGRVLCRQISRDLTDELGVTDPFFIIAPWGSEQFAREGDMFVAPLPSLDEIYRIGHKEFDETYAPDDEGGGGT